MRFFYGIMQLLRSDGSIIANKALSRVIGLEPTLIYSELISKYMYWSERGELTEDGYFYCTVENLQHDTTLTKHKQIKAIKSLVKLGLIEYDERRKITASNGVVMTVRHFKIVEDESKLLYLLNLDKQENTPQTLANNEKLKNLTTPGQKIEPPLVKKLNTNNTNINNTKVNKDDDDREQQQEEKPKPKSIIINQELIYNFCIEWREKTQKDILLTIQQKEKLQKLINEYSYETVIDVLGKVEHSKYLSEKMTITHFLTLEIFIKIANDTYKDHKQIENNNASASNTNRRNTAFTNMYKHEWDLDELEKQASDYMEYTLYGDR